MSIFEDRILKNPRLLKLKNPTTGETINFEIEDYTEDEIEQKGTEVSAEILNKVFEGTVLYSTTKQETSITQINLSEKLSNYKYVKIDVGRIGLPYCVSFVFPVTKDLANYSFEHGVQMYEHFSETIQFELLKFSDAVIEISDRATYTESTDSSTGYINLKKTSGNNLTIYKVTGYQY